MRLHQDRRRSIFANSLLLCDNEEIDRKGHPGVIVSNMRYAPVAGLLAAEKSQHRTIPHLGNPLQCVQHLLQLLLLIHLFLQYFTEGIVKKKRSKERFVNECDNCHACVISAKNNVYLFLLGRTREGGDRTTNDHSTTEPFLRQGFVHPSPPPLGTLTPCPASGSAQPLQLHGIPFAQEFVYGFN